jgi:alkyl hydroperoxide reductase subunit AhpC
VLLYARAAVWVEGQRDSHQPTHGKPGGFSFSAEIHPDLKAAADQLSQLQKFEFTRRPAMTTETATETQRIPRINDTAPDFTAETTQGTIHFHDWIGNGWAILFSHPKDFTPVCTTELGYMAGLQPEFAKRNTKIIGLSVDPVTSHGKWAADIEETQGHKVNYPMIGDPELKIAKLYGMLPAETGHTSEGRTAADNATVRTVFVVGPDKKIKLQLSYPMSTGRNFDEILRVIDSIQLTAKHKVSTPVNWKPGDDVIISGNVSNEEAQKQYPAGWKSPKPYIRIVPQPK